MEKDIAIRIGKNIANARKSKGLTQETVAEKLGIDTGSLSRMERGIIMPSVPMLDRMADELDVALWQLIDSAPLSSVTMSENISTLLKKLTPNDRKFLLTQIEMWVQRLSSSSANKYNK